MPGPPPKHPSERRRRNATVPMTQLPAGGRPGAPPKWPLGETPKGRLAWWWKRLWKKPQAVAWERHGLEEAVARYCLVMTRFEAGELTAPIMTECRNLEDRLGLNAVAMLRLRWEVAADELAERRATPAAATRPKVVDPDAMTGG